MGEVRRKFASVDKKPVNLDSRNGYFMALDKDSTVGAITPISAWPSLIVYVCVLVELSLA